MNSNNLAKYSTTSYNSLFNNIKNYTIINNQNRIRKTSKTQISNNNDKSLINISLLSTKLNSSDSFLFKSIYMNNSLKLFKLKHLSIKNQFFTSTINKSNEFDFKKYLKRKLSENLERIKLNGKFAKTTNINNFKINNSYLEPSAESSRSIERISFFDKIFRNELFDFGNYNINLDYNKDNNAFYFKESTKKRALIRNYIYQKKKKYENDLKYKERYTKVVNKNCRKINILYNDAIKNQINKLVDYNFYLKEKIKKMKQEDVELYRQIEQLLKLIKELFIQIKIKSDQLWNLFDIRNFLICVKEKTSLKKLPLAFRCYNSEYLDELTKINEIDISTQKGKDKSNKSNFFHIPSNLLAYIKTLNGLENVNIDEKFRKYLNPKYKIFESPDDFIKVYKTTEKKILDYLKNYLVETNLNEKIKFGLCSTIKYIENDRNNFQKDFDEANKSYIIIKNNNDKMNIKKLRYSAFSEDIKKRAIEEENYKEQNNLYVNYNRGKYDEKFLKLIRSNIDVEKTNFLYKFYQLKKIKNFHTEKEYVYFYISNNILNFYKKCPKYFYRQEAFSFNKFNEFIDNFLTSNKLKDSESRKIILYLLNIYETAINNFLNDYENTITKFGKTDAYYTIRKEKINEKKLHLFEKKKIMDIKIKKMKIDKYNRKFLKFRYIERSNLSNSSMVNFFSKGKSFEIKKNNKKDFENENYLLKY